jgi:hypothetical protein
MQQYLIDFKKTTTMISKKVHNSMSIVLQVCILALSFVIWSLMVILVPILVVCPWCLGLYVYIFVFVLVTKQKVTILEAHLMFIYTCDVLWISRLILDNICHHNLWFLLAYLLKKFDYFLIYLRYLSCRPII